MRKQVQKERCTKIMLTKCKAVCHLYDKVQLAAAKMLDSHNQQYQTRHNTDIRPILGFHLLQVYVCYHNFLIYLQETLSHNQTHTARA